MTVVVSLSQYVISRVIRSVSAVGDSNLTWLLSAPPLVVLLCSLSLVFFVPLFLSFLSSAVD